MKEQPDRQTDTTAGSKNPDIVSMFSFYFFIAAYLSKERSGGIKEPTLLVFITCQGIYLCFASYQLNKVKYFPLYLSVRKLKL